MRRDFNFFSEDFLEIKLSVYGHEVYALLGV